MASDGASPLPGPDMTMAPGAAVPSSTAPPFPQPPPGAPEQPPWESAPQPAMPSAFPPGRQVLSAFPSPLLMTGDGVAGPSGAGAGNVIVKVKTEAGPTEHPPTQNFILTQPSFNWIATGAPLGGPEGPAPQFVTTSNVKTILPTKSIGVSQESLPSLPPQAPPPAVQLTPVVTPEKAWPGPHGAPGEGGPADAQSGPSLGELSSTSKGVYENFRRWQHYKALARRHLSQSPDAEAFSCFLIPVLRSLARLRPTMTLEEGLPRAVQEWEHTSNFDRMTFYEMAEKFMEFEAEEEMQIQNAKLLNGSQCLPPAAPLKLDPPASPAPEVCQQPVYIPKKAASKTRAPRRRQHKSQNPPVPKAPKEIPPEAVKEYVDIMEGLLGSLSATGESDGNEEEEQQQEEGMYPDPGLLSYVNELCSQEDFVSKVEAVIHPRFLADLLSPEQHRDPFALIEELEQEEGLTLTELVQKRLMALEEEDAEVPASCSGAHSDSSPSISDEDEDGGAQLRPSPGSQMPGSTVCTGKAVSPRKQAREGHGGQQRATDCPQGMGRNGSTLPSPSNWDLQSQLESPQVVQGPSSTERRGSGTIINQITPNEIGHLEEETNNCSLPGPLRASSPVSKTKENNKQNPVTVQAPRDLWSESCCPLLESRIDGPTLGSSTETHSPVCANQILTLETQDDASSPEANKGTGSGGNSTSPLLETTEHSSILDVGDGHGLQLGEVSEGNGPSNFTTYDLQGEKWRETDLLKPKDLASLPQTPKSTSRQHLRSTSLGCRTRDALALKERSPVSEARSSAGGVKREKEEEDEELSNFAYLLASKLSLSPRGLPCSPCPTTSATSTSQFSNTHHSNASAEALSYTAPKPGKQALVGEQAPAKKKPHPGAGSEENPSALVVHPSKPRKRRRDSFAKGRRKKRRNNQ
ncbi:NUT family member 1 [Rhynchocyon petersi]